MLEEFIKLKHVLTVRGEKAMITALPEFLYQNVNHLYGRFNQ
jgi:hypothetical protein